MRDDDKPTDELVAEVRALRSRVEELERAQRAAAQDPMRRLRDLLDKIPAMVFTTDTELRLTSWTGGGIEPLNAEPELYMGIDIYEFFGTRDPNHPAIAANLRARNGEDVTYETHFAGRVAHSHVEPLRDARGAIVGVIGVAFDITERKAAEAERERAIVELRAALDRVRTLSGLIPICVHCKNIRNDRGYWEQVDTWVREHSDAEFSHGICPECIKHVMPETGT